MVGLAFILALIALVVALAALNRTGGIEALRRQVQGMTSSTDSLRDQMADALDRLEHLIRGRDRPRPPERPEDSSRDEPR
jgi:hypothetical protein